MFPKLIFSGLLCLLLSGCFEIIEEVTYKSKESGTFSLTLNCSKSKTRLKTLLKLDTFMGANIPKEHEIREYISVVTNAIRETPGINNISQSIDMDNYIASVTFGFDRTEALNNALNNAAKQVDKHKDLAFTDIFSLKNNTFMRHRVPDDSTKTARIKPEMLRLITDASITSIYRFSSEVKDVSNSKALISKSRKAVMLKKNISEVIAKPECFTNTITF